MGEVIVLSRATWERIEKMLKDYEDGSFTVIPGLGLKYEEHGGGVPGHGGPVTIGVDGIDTCP